MLIFRWILRATKLFAWSVLIFCEGKKNLFKRRLSYAVIINFHDILCCLKSSKYFRPLDIGWRDVVSHHIVIFLSGSRKENSVVEKWSVAFHFAYFKMESVKFLLMNSLTESFSFDISFDSVNFNVKTNPSPNLVFRCCVEPRHLKDPLTMIALKNLMMMRIALWELF